MSENPAHPDADPTAPGGMSQKALAAELIREHGWTKDQIKAEFREDKKWKVGSWPAMIDLVVQGRLDREREAKATSVDREADPEELLAEMAEARAGDQLLIPEPGTKNYIFSGHWGAGPSASERWMNCTASLQASREFLETLSPNQQREFATANISARQGTTAHEVGETKIRLMLGEIEDVEADNILLDLATTPPDGEHYDEEMEVYTSEYVDLAKTYYDEGREILVESQVVAAVPLPDDEVYEIAGHADLIVLPSDEEPVLVVGDLKYGRGIDVPAEANSQARIYALGALGLLADEEGSIPALESIRYHIIQPRLGGIKTWTESIEDLLTWRDEELSPALALALGGIDAGAEFSPSEQACQFCPARGTCPALTTQRVEAAADLFEVITEAELNGQTPDLLGLPNDRLGELLSQIEDLVDLRKDLREEAQRRLHRGGSVPGFKLVSYTPKREWAEGAAEELEGIDDLWARKLITPTQALKVLKDEAHTIEELIVVPEKRPIIAKASSNRAEWTGRAPEDMFPDEEEETP